MIPQIFMKLDTIPLAVYGKRDLKRLPKSFLQRITKQKIVSPNNANQKIISEVWKKVLEVDRVSIRDSFFDFGGHSLLMMKAFNEIFKMVDCDLKLMDMFFYATVES